MENQRTVKETTRGRITLPAEFRRKLGVDGEGLWEMSLVDGSLRLVPIDPRETDQNYLGESDTITPALPANHSS